LHCGQSLPVSFFLFGERVCESRPNPGTSLRVNIPRKNGPTSTPNQLRIMPFSPPLPSSSRPASRLRTPPSRLLLSLRSGHILVFWDLSSSLLFTHHFPFTSGNECNSPTVESRIASFQSGRFQTSVLAPSFMGIHFLFFPSETQAFIGLLDFNFYPFISDAEERAYSQFSPFVLPVDGFFLSLDPLPELWINALVTFRNLT